MRKYEKKQILKNVGSSWSALAVNVLVGIFLSPFILHRLGDTAFGVWVLIFSVTGYYGLFDLGIRSSIIRYVSKYTATGENGKLACFVNTSLFTYTIIGAVSMALTTVLSSYLGGLFRIPPEMHNQAHILLLLVGASVSLGFPLGVFGGMLEGLQRFYILNWTSIGSSLLRAALIVHFLNRGYGLITVALITVGLPLLSSILRAIIVFRFCPVPLGLRYVDKESFRNMATYGGTTFLVIVAGRLRFRTDELVLGRMMSAVAITYFSIGARIVDYAQEFVSSLAQIFVPMASQSEAKNDLDRLRKVYIAGNRVCALLILPITVILILLGKHVIRIWVGAALHSAQLPGVGGADYSLRAHAHAVGFGTRAVRHGKASIHGKSHSAGRDRQLGPQYCAGSAVGGGGGRAGYGRSAVLHVPPLHAAPFSETDRRAREQFRAPGVFVAFSAELAAGGSGLAGKQGLYSQEPGPVGDGNWSGVPDLWHRCALGL